MIVSFNILFYFMYFSLEDDFFYLVQIVGIHTEALPNVIFSSTIARIDIEGYILIFL